MSLKPKKPKLAYIVSRFPYPLEKGDKLRAYYQLKELSLTHEIYLFALTEEKISIEHIALLKKYCKSVEVFRLKWWLIALQIALSFFSNSPFQVAYFYDPLIARRIRKKLSAIQPDHIFCQLIRASEYVKDYHLCPKTLDYMDAFSKGMERRVKSAPWYSRWLFQSETKRLGRYEQAIFSYFEHKLIISEQDRNLIMHPQRNEIICVPNGIDQTFFEAPEKTAIYDLVFVGNLSYAPNVEAVAFIDKLMKELPNRTCLISGANPSPIVRRIARGNPSIHLLGWVEDIRSSYCSGKVFVAPMTIGTGMQNKLLEAMALGIPCITTPLAGNAIHASDGVNLLLADDLMGFSAAFKQLESDVQLYESVSKSASHFVRKHYSWQQANSLILHHCLSFKD